jgi:hypothetical protein
MTQFIDDLKKTFSLIKKQTEGLGNTITTIRDRIMLLEAEYSTILDRPLSKEDMLNLILARLDKTAEAEDARWIEHFLGESQRRAHGNSYRAYSVADIRRTGRGAVDEMDYLVPSWFHRGNSGGPISSDAIFSLLREPLKAAVRGYFDRIVEWPHANALPAETYFPRLDEIETELADLREQESLLMAQAKELGVSLPAPYDMGSNRYD